MLCPAGHPGEMQDLLYEEARQLIRDAFAKSILCPRVLTALGKSRIMPNSQEVPSCLGGESHVREPIMASQGNDGELLEVNENPGNEQNQPVEEAKMCMKSNHRPNAEVTEEDGCIRCLEEENNRLRKQLDDLHIWLLKLQRALISTRKERDAEHKRTLFLVRRFAEQERILQEDNVRLRLKYQKMIQELEQALKQQQTLVQSSTLELEKAKSNLEKLNADLLKTTANLQKKNAELRAGWIQAASKLKEHEQRPDHTKNTEQYEERVEARCGEESDADVNRRSQGTRGCSTRKQQCTAQRGGSAAADQRLQEPQRSEAAEQMQPQRRLKANQMGLERIAGNSVSLIPARTSDPWREPFGTGEALPASCIPQTLHVDLIPKAITAEIAQQLLEELKQQYLEPEIFAVTIPADARGIWVGHWGFLTAVWTRVTGAKTTSLAKARKRFPADENVSYRSAVYWARMLW